MRQAALDSGRMERAPAAHRSLLTFASSAGCACKLAQADLAKVLSALPKTADARALVGFDTSDDAAVFRVGDAADPHALCVVSTTDFFTPVVEKPFDFGRVAAANALSDVWAMGGEPLFALNLVGFPTAKLPMEVLHEILRGGAAIAAEAGIPILGGHSVDFDVPVYGMAVTGQVKASAVRRNAGARPGDALVLSKALGTGILTSAMRGRALAAGSALGFLKRPPDVANEEAAAAVASMTRLNRTAARAADGLDVSACTDVTGFGLLGHLHEMLEASGAAGEVAVRSVPELPGARRLSEEGIEPAGSRRNRETARRFTTTGSGVGAADLALVSDAQTSGGLLFAVAANDAETLVARLRAGGDPPAAVVGRVVAGEAGRIAVS